MLKTVCPSCQREYEEYQGFSTLLCAECVKFRDKNYEHSEEKVQEELKKQLDRRFKK